MHIPFIRKARRVLRVGRLIGVPGSVAFGAVRFRSHAQQFSLSFLMSLSMRCAATRVGPRAASRHLTFPQLHAGWWWSLVVTYVGGADYFSSKSKLSSTLWRYSTIKQLFNNFNKIGKLFRTKPFVRTNKKLIK